MTFTWTDERIAELRRLWAEGLSASQVAGEMGGGLTRNAVIGKVHRLGLERRRQARPRRRSNPISSYRLVPLPEWAPQLKSQRGPTGPLNIRLLDLLPFHCRYPTEEINDRAIGFCGHPTVHGTSWCEHHLKIVTGKKLNISEPDHFRRVRHTIQHMEKARVCAETKFWVDDL